ncbi:unnamed protein product, partial [Mesorhabditis spiculigera]
MAAPEKEPLQPKDGKEKGNARNGGVKLKPNPERTANFLSRLFFWYIGPLFIYGYRRNLEPSDMFEPLPEQESRAATEELRKGWENEQKTAKTAGRPPSLMKAMLRTYRGSLSWCGLLLFLEEVIKLVQPLFMGRLIRYFRFDHPLTAQDAYIAAAGVAITSALVATVHHPYFYGLQKIGLRVKVAASGLVTEKGFGLSSAAIRDTSVGHMVNLLSTDVTKYDMSFIFFHYIWVSPLIVIGYSIVIYQQIGVAAIAGFAAYFLLFPIQGLISKKMGQFRHGVAARSDKRLSVMTEILAGIRLIKMYSWEDAFSDIVKHLRHNELQMIRKQASCQALLMGLFWPSSKLVILFAAIAYFVQGELMLAEPIFVASALFHACRLPVMLFLPLGIAMFQEARVSTQRIQAFLALEDFHPVERKPEGHDNSEIPMERLGASAERKPLIRNGQSELTEQWCELQPDNPKTLVELSNYSSSWARPNADIYLLDDPLSAVDAAVGRFIFDK